MHIHKDLMQIEIAAAASAVFRDASVWVRTPVSEVSRQKNNFSFAQAEREMRWCTLMFAKIVKPRVD
jgi:hypothetical protein